MSNITKRAPRTRRRRMSNMSSESPVRVTRSTKSLVPQETSGELLEIGESQASRKTSCKKYVSSVGLPTTLRLSAKSLGDRVTSKLSLDSSEDESSELLAYVASKNKESIMKTDRTRIRRLSVKSDAGKSASGVPSKDDFKEQSLTALSKKSSAKHRPEISPKLVMDVTSEDETHEPSSATSAKNLEPGKLLQKWIRGSPRTRRLSENSSGGSGEGSSDKLIIDLSSEDESNEPLTGVLSKNGETGKSAEKSSLGSLRARKLSGKSPREIISDNLVIEVSPDDERTDQLSSTSPKKNKTRQSLKKSTPGGPRTSELSEKSFGLRMSKLITETSSDEEPEDSRILSNKPQQRKSLEIANSGSRRPLTLSGSKVESAISDSLSKKLSVVDISESAPVSRKKNRRRKSSENSTLGSQIHHKLSEKSADCLQADRDLKGSFDSSRGDESGRKLGDCQASDLSALIADVSLTSDNTKSKKKKRKNRSKGGNLELQAEDVNIVRTKDNSTKAADLEVIASIADVPLNSDNVKSKRKKRSKGRNRVSPERQADDEDIVRTKENSSEAADSEVMVRRRGGGSIIESRPVFSEDAKYVYLNCGWGVRVFSVETGECVRVFDAFSKAFKVVNCFCWNTLPAALTSEGVFIAWDPRSGKIQQKVRMHVKTTELVIDGFFISCEESSPLLCLVIESKEYTSLRVYSGTNFRSFGNHPLSARKIAHPYKQHCLSAGGDPKHPFVAYIDSTKRINVVNMENKCFFRNSNPPDKHWTCVRAHPTEDTLAAGDSLGRIVMFRRLSASHPGKTHSVNSVYHWHTLPVGEIAFTPAGSSMYSGGGELTLVKWNVENPQVRNFLPRMSADIVHIAISPYNQMVAVATRDNGVQIVTPTNQLQCILQQLSWSVIATEQEKMFPSGLQYDPRSRGLILNSRPGHLQLYSPHSETLTYNIDVTMLNYLTQERDKVIVNTQVTHSALTSDGLWLATVETRYEPGLALELRLKFWLYTAEKTKFVLTTVVDMPHDGLIHTIKFSPQTSNPVSNEIVEPDSEVMLASTGADGKMRLWSKTPINSIYQKGYTWRCKNTLDYHDQPCGPCSFSQDGSVIAGGFGPSVPLWGVESLNIQHSLTISREHIKFLEFGRDDCCHMLMCATESVVMAWNLLKYFRCWKVDLKSTVFVADPYSSFAAVFTVDNQWKILDAHNGEVVYTMNSSAGKSEVSDRPQKQQVLAAVFVPRHRPNTEAPMWMSNSYLYFIDVYQELNCLEPVNEIAQLPKFQLALDRDSSTLFGSLVGPNSVREKADEEHSKTVGYGVFGAPAVAELLVHPAYELPPVKLLCGSFLQSFVILKRNPSDESDHDDKKEDDKSTVIASSDSEQEVEMPTFSAPTSRPKKSVKTADRRAQSATPSESTLEPMETDIDLSKHFPKLAEDEDEPCQKALQGNGSAQVFIIDE